MTPKTQTLIDECKLIEENSTYTAHTHFILAEKKSLQYKVMTLLPAIIGGVSGASIALGGPSWLGWLSLISGVLVAVISVLDPEKQAGEHLSTAKEFTILKHDARALHESFYQFMSEKEFYQSTKSLLDRYSMLVSNAPLASNAPFKSNLDVFLEARNFIKGGMHEPDFKSKTSSKSDVSKNNS